MKLIGGRSTFPLPPPPPPRPVIVSASSVSLRKGARSNRQWLGQGRLFYGMKVDRAWIVDVFLPHKFSGGSRAAREKCGTRFGKTMFQGILTHVRASTEKCFVLG